MKRYLLFCFNDYYPSGGFNDFENSFDTIDEAINYFETKKEYSNCQIVDKDTFEIVYNKQTDE
jgi:hypothetical protein